MRINSYAKINLGLEVIGKREDGYHDLLTLFQNIDLFDVLEFSHSSREEIALRGDDPAVPWDETNLIARAARLLRETCRVSAGVRITVRKRVPAGKGLGGGSSNAAMTLHALNKIWGLGLGRQRLSDLAKSLGADVPYFLEGGLCLGLDRGDRLVRLPDLPPMPCLLALPPLPLLTAEVYGRYRPSLTSGAKDSKIVRFLETRDFGLLENSLEETIFSLYPQLREIKSLFQSQGAALSLVSGSGSAVFGLYLEKALARRARSAIGRVSSVRLVETLPRKNYWKRVNAGV